MRRCLQAKAALLPVQFRIHLMRLDHYRHMSRDQPNISLGAGIDDALGGLDRAVRRCEAHLHLVSLQVEGVRRRPDVPFPATACLLQAKLGLRRDIPCFDISAACSGFVYALQVGTDMLKSGRYQRALVIGAEKLSSVAQSIVWIVTPLPVVMIPTMRSPGRG